MPRRSVLQAAVSRRCGFTYLGLLVLVAILALVSVAALKLGAVSQRRLNEQALLETGAAFAAALRSYARATPRGQADAPTTLQDLLKDPRFPGTVRHLRKIFIDPLTGNDEWGLVRDPDGDGIVGVYSLFKGRPIKLANFDDRFADFEGKLDYSEWRFTRPNEPDPNGDSLRKGLVSGAVLGGDEGRSPAAPEPEPALGQPPNAISSGGLR